MSDCGGDCGGGDYGGDSGGGDVQTTTFDSDYPAETTYSQSDYATETTNFESDYPAETTYSQSDYATETTNFESDYPAQTTYSQSDYAAETTNFESDYPAETTYFDSNVPADESCHGDENSRVFETVEMKHVNESYSFYAGSNNCDYENGYPPSRSYISSDSSGECGCGTCIKIFLVASTMFIVLIVLIFILKKD